MVGFNIQDICFKILKLTKNLFIFKNIFFYSLFNLHQYLYIMGIAPSFKFIKTSLSSIHFRFCKDLLKASSVFFLSHIFLMALKHCGIFWTELKNPFESRAFYCPKIHDICAFIFQGFASLVHALTILWNPFIKCSQIIWFQNVNNNACLINVSIKGKSLRLAMWILLHRDVYLSTQLIWDFFPLRNLITVP